MKSRSIVAASVLVAALGSAAVAAADSKTVIEESPGKYIETRKNADGTESKYEVNREKGTAEYKDSRGVSVQERTENGKVKQEYKDENGCRKSVQRDLVTGEEKLVLHEGCQGDD